MKRLVLLSVAASLGVTSFLIGRAPHHQQCVLSGSMIGPTLFGCWSDQQIADFRRCVRSAPPEFRAHAYTKLVESGRLSNSKLEIEFLEEAFEDATQAAWPMPARNEQGAEPIADPRGFCLRSASRGLLDRLSLQSRVVMAMYARDTAAARAMFYRIEPPVPRRITCADDAVEDPSAYLQTASIIKAQILARNARPLVSSMQIRPLTKALANGFVPCPDLRRQVENLTADLATLKTATAISRLPYAISRSTTP